MNDYSAITGGEQQKSSLGHFPQGEKWTFDASVALCFEDMLERSIPLYFEMRDLCYRVGRNYVAPGHPVIDLGCSNGRALIPFVHEFEQSNTFIGVEISDPMIDIARTHFKDQLSVEIRKLDLRENYLPEMATLTLSIFTLQFIPIEHRQRLVRNIYLHTKPGGAFLLVEKVLGSSAELDSLLVKEYLALKSRNGYSEEEIERKRLSLEGILVPVTSSWNKQLLRMAGFSQVDCFWRYLNFTGWIALKE